MTQSSFSGVFVGMDDDGRIEIDPRGDGPGYAFHVNDRDRELINVRGLGSELRLHTRERATENEVVRYGFLSHEDRRCFDRLVAVSGVGPGTALRVLSVLDAERVIEAVRERWPTTFTCVPGIGPKMAAKIIKEVKL